MSILSLEKTVSRMKGHMRISS